MFYHVYGSQERVLLQNCESRLFCTWTFLDGNLYPPSSGGLRKGYYRKQHVRYLWRWLILYPIRYHWIPWVFVTSSDLAHFFVLYHPCARLRNSKKLWGQWILRDGSVSRCFFFVWEGGKSKNVFYLAYVCFRNAVRLLMEEILHHLKRIPVNNGINYLSTGWFLLSTVCFRCYYVMFCFATWRKQNGSWRWSSSKINTPLEH